MSAPKPPIRSHAESVALYAANEGLAYHFANNYPAGWRVDREDLEQVCKMALWIAVQRWNGSASVATWTYIAMRQRANDTCRRSPMIYDKGSTGRRRLWRSIPVGHLNVHSEHTEPSAPFVDPDAEILRAELLALVHVEIAKLSDVQRRVIRLRFGPREVALEEVGRELGVCRERARQIEAEAIDALRRAMRRRARRLA